MHDLLSCWLRARWLRGCDGVTARYKGPLRFDPVPVPQHLDIFDSIPHLLATITLSPTDC